ncbi:MAG: hypothetical protein V1875_04220 [Candidatus Altiarchaeota archaeon]
MKTRLAKFLPIENFVIETGLSAAEVSGRIASSTSFEKSFGSRLMSVRKKPFEGIKTAGGYRLFGFQGRNSFFSPITDAGIRESPSGSEVHVRMRLEYWVLGLIAIWLGFSGLIALVNAAYALSSENTLSAKMIGVLFPGILFSLGYLACIIGFKLDSRNIRAYLDALFKK